jgi:homoserine O-acetyltransferase
MAMAAMTPRSLASAFIRFILPADNFTGVIMARAEPDGGPRGARRANRVQPANAKNGNWWQSPFCGAFPIGKPVPSDRLCYHEDTPKMIVSANTVRFDSMALDNGTTLGPIDVAYETYGELNAAKTNAIMVLHAFSGDAHAAGISAETGKPGWWDNMIGPGKAFDTNLYFVICSNVLGGCRGTTGPGSLNPATGCPYAMSFPVITIGDMVRLQKMLIDSFGIQRLLSVTGGSMGGMQALEWAAAYPGSVVSAIPVATTTRHSAQQIAFNEVGRQAIMADPDWADGNYYDKQPPARGLAVARMVGHITYMSDDSMREKFGRRLRGKENFSFGFDVDFEVESYLRYRGSQFVYRFDANSYLYITKAMDYFDLTNGQGTLAAALEKTQARFLVISFSSDWLYPSYQSQELVRALRSRNRDVAYVELESNYGHDSFLVDVVEQTDLVRGFLASTFEKAQ